MSTTPAFTPDGTPSATMPAATRLAPFSMAELEIFLEGASAITLPGAFQPTQAALTTELLAELSVRANMGATAVL